MREGGGINLYQFCGGDPINAIDPCGLSIFSVPVDGHNAPPFVKVSIFSSPYRPTPSTPSIRQADMWEVGALEAGVRPRIIPELHARNPNTYQALLIGAPNLVGTPVGEEMAVNNAVQLISAPGEGIVVARIAPLIIRSKPIAMPKQRVGSTEDFVLNVGNNKGILGTIDRNGVVEFAIEAGSESSVRGGEMFRQMMDHFGTNVRAVRGNWVYGDNLTMVNKLTAEGTPLAEAVSQTWTASQTARYGFTKPTIEAAVGNAGKYSEVRVLFEKP